MKYLYYKLWQTFKRIPTNDMPATNAMLFISMCHLANIFVIQIILNHNSLANMKFSSKSEIYSYTIPLGLLAFGLNYLFLYRNRDRIYEKYKDESKRQKLIGNILLILYILGSFALVFYFGSKYTVHPLQ
ncbi:MAG: hypothetical protein M0R21_08660 [Lentimicrobiaceae bacterium]|jgi:hypothetical protein|nr:hypothetical protein [Lentimicrobiaceae bacterium]